MARKKSLAKRASSSNPAQSPEGILDRGILRNLRDHKRDILANRGFVHGREVNLGGIGHHDTFRTFEALGWDTFLFKSCVVSPQHIREFYAGYVLDEAKGNVELQLYDNFYTWTINQFCSILGLPRAPTKIYTTSSSLSTIQHLVDRNTLLETIVRQDLDPTTLVHINDQILSEERKLWNKIILANIFPRNGNTDRLAALQAYLLYCLVKCEKVDVGYIVLKRMEGLELINRSLPYGILLNRLFEFLGLPPCLTALPGKPINRLTLSRMEVGFTCRERRWKEEAVRGNGVIRESSRENCVNGEASREIGVNGESSQQNKDEDLQGFGTNAHQFPQPLSIDQFNYLHNHFGPQFIQLQSDVAVVRDQVGGIRQTVDARWGMLDQILDRLNHLPNHPGSGPNADQFPEPRSLDQFNYWHNKFKPQFIRLQSDVVAVCEKVGGIKQTVDAQSNMLHQILDRLNRFPYSPP